MDNSIIINYSNYSYAITIAICLLKHSEPFNVFLFSLIRPPDKPGPPGPAGLQATDEGIGEFRELLRLYEAPGDFWGRPVLGRNSDGEFF